ncbi:MAG: glycosyltransferase family 4 protein [Patescibacteria group bacterium]
MPKILLPTIDFPPARGGVARYIGAIQKTYPDQVSVLQLGKKQKLGNLVLHLLWSSRSFDAIWTHHVLPIGTAAMIVKKITKKPYVVFLHGLDFDLARRNSWKRQLVKQVLGSADRIVTNSEALASEVRDFVQFDRTPLVVYPMLEDRFIEAAKVPRKPGEKVNLQKLGELALGVSRSVTPMFTSSKKTSQQPLRLLTVARLVERKGHLKILEALKLIPDATYHIVGDGPMLGAIESVIAEHGLEDRVRIDTDVSDEQLPDIYRDADIFVMPTTKTETDREGFGIVYLEAQLFGLPVIATRHPGVDEAIRDGEGGLLIGDSINELVGAINRLKDPATQSKFGSRGRMWVEREFNREQQMYKLRELL